MPNLRSEFKTDRFEQLPVERECNRCGLTKPRSEMIIQHRREKDGSTYYYFRPLCKACNNVAERGHRRDYKRKYLQNWRRQNAALNESYWKDNDATREAAKLRARDFSQEQKDAIAIQRRLRKRGEFVTIAEARELLTKFGRCYPTRFGLSKAGLKRCEQIRSRLRQRSAKKAGSFGYRMMSSFEIRMMVYEEAEEEIHFLVPPEKQPIPYKKAARNLKRYWQKKRAIEAV